MDTTKPPTDPSAASPLAKTEPPPAEPPTMPAPPAEVTTATEPVPTPAAAPISPEPAFTPEPTGEAAFAASDADAERARRQNVSAQVMALVERAVTEAADLVRPLCAPGHEPEEQARLMLVLMTASTYHAITGQGHAALRQVKEAFGPVELQKKAAEGKQIRIVDLPKAALEPIWDDVIEGTKQQIAANQIPVAAEELCAQAMLELVYATLVRAQGRDKAAVTMELTLAGLTSSPGHRPG